MLISDRITELAVAVASDYPDITNISSFEQLYAIETTFKGHNLALRDWRLIADNMRQQLGMSKTEFVDFGSKIIRSNNGN